MSEALPTYLEIKLVRIVCGRERGDKQGRGEPQAAGAGGGYHQFYAGRPAAHWVNTASSNADPPNLNTAFHGAQASH